MKDNSKVVVALLAGLAAGAALGLLFAPEPGEDTRDSLSRTIKDFADKVKDFAGNEIDKLSKVKENVSEQVKEKFNEEKEKLSDDLSDQPA